MLRSIVSRRTLMPCAILLLLFAAVAAGLYASNQNAASAASPYVSLNNSFTAPPAGAHLSGSHTGSARLTISVNLTPSNAPQLESLLKDLFTPGNSRYHHWLKTGQFEKLYGPQPAQVAQVQSYLQAQGLQVSVSPSTFLVRATGTTAQVEAAFRTGIKNYRTANGKSFYKNDSAVEIPASLQSSVLGVIGLSSVSPKLNDATPTPQAAHKANKKVPHYGAGPGGSGLTPSQTASIYGATSVYKLGSRGKGKGATLAVFELSGYTPSDIGHYEHTFFGSKENVHLVNINVDGGPITPQCPVGDSCGPFTAGPPCANGCNSADYSGDIEVEADIETQIAIAPKISRILVYNAPNDLNNTTTVDEYLKIAHDNLADSISTSWGLCELDEGLASIKAESIAFEQMATQGQSMFDAAGDTGAFGCLRGSGYTGLKAEDPSTQPWVTSVGGTSFGTYDPGSNQHPSYPKGAETVWNPMNACSPAQDSVTGQCSTLGAGGGGVSSVWGKPFYQHGPGVITSLSQKAPYCQLAAAGQYCREVPDVSANADEFTPYAEYCTGNPATNSTCATFSSTQVPPGWFGIGGTSLSSPLWSGIIALWDSVHGQRFGSASPGLYQLFRSHDAYSKYFHDITENNNGFYPTTANYDMATGIGTPHISNIARTRP